MMRDVVTRGTAARARVLKRRDLAGKTGTTNDQKDAWFSGFIPGLVATAWVGFDQVAPLGKVYQAGTLSGNPLAVAGWREQPDDIRHPAVQRRVGPVEHGERLGQTERGTVATQESIGDRMKGA